MAIRRGYESMVDIHDGVKGETGDTGADSTIAGPQGSFQRNIFIRDATKPTTPTGGSYNGSTNVLTPPTGWSVNIPSGSLQLWTTFAIVDPSSSFALSAWSEAGEYSGATGPAGEVGPRSRSGTAFLTIAQTATPSAPSATSFNFTTLNFGGLTTGWNDTQPTFNATGNPYWVSGYNIVETTFGGLNTITFGNPRRVFNFDGILTNVDLPIRNYWYTDTAGLFSEIGDPGTPGTGVTWTSVGTTPTFPDDAFWVAERTTTGTNETPFTIFPINTKETGFPIVPTYNITRAYPGIPAINSPQWNLDTIEAVEAWTGRDYSTVREFGYGTVVVIDYNITGSSVITASLGINLPTGDYTFVPTTGSLDSFPDKGTIEIGSTDNRFVYTSKSSNGFTGANQSLTGNSIGTTVTLQGSAATAGVGKVHAIYKRDRDGDKWVGNDPFIAGDLIVEETIAANKIQTNSLTAAQIATNTITAGEIAAGTITSSEIATNTITADQIDTSTLKVQELSLDGTLTVASGVAGSGAIAWGKTSAKNSQRSTNGLYIGNDENGVGNFLLGDGKKFIQWDGSDLIISGAIYPTPVDGSPQTFHGGGTFDVNPFASSIRIEVSGGGGGGQAANAYNPVGGGGGNSSTVNITDSTNGQSFHTVTGSGGGISGGNAGQSFNPSGANSQFSGSGGSAGGGNNSGGGNANGISAGGGSNGCNCGPRGGQAGGYTEYILDLSNHGFANTPDRIQIQSVGNGGPSSSGVSNRNGGSGTGGLVVITAIE